MSKLETTHESNEQINADCDIELSSERIEEIRSGFFWDRIKPIYGQLQVKNGVLKADEAIEEAKRSGFTIGAKVKLSHDDEIGEVVGYNQKIHGFYPASVFPILVKFERGTFEYRAKGLVLVSNLDQ